MHLHYCVMCSEDHLLLHGKTRDSLLFADIPNPTPPPPFVYATNSNANVLLTILDLFYLQQCSAVSTLTFVAGEMMSQ